jgi:hypothetical protein
VFVVCGVDSGMFDGLIPRPEECYRVCVCICLAVCMCVCVSSCVCVFV